MLNLMEVNYGPTGKENGSSDEFCKLNFGHFWK